MHGLVHCVVYHDGVGHAVLELLASALRVVHAMCLFDRCKWGSQCGLCLPKNNAIGKRGKPKVTRPSRGEDPEAGPSEQRRKA